MRNNARLYLGQEKQHMKNLLLSAVFTSLLFTGTLRADDKPVINLWPKGLPAGAQPIPAERAKKLTAESNLARIRYVETPSITVFKAPAKIANGAAVVVCPGGGYNILAWDHEGLQLAEWFNTLGVTAVVLKYRVPRRRPEIHIEPLQDAQRAIRLVRLHAKEWSVDPNRVGVLGFSAGGHLTVMTGTQWKTSSYPPIDETDDLSCRPDFICPIYCAYLGPDYKDNKPELGPLVRITNDTPPTFSAVTADDTMRGAQAALLFVELKKNKVPAELHIYTNGGHGYGIRPSDKPVSTWHHRLAAWLKAQGILAPKS